MIVQTIEIIHAAITTALAGRPHRPLVIGLCGAQGSGKSTVAAALRTRLEGEAIRTAILSLDDLYLTKTQRRDLAARVHPLLATRGVPGTHDVGLGLDIFAALDRSEAARLPAFDKAIDDRAPETSWTTAPAGTQVLLFEGWCVGARPQTEDALTTPVNRLESEEDPDGTWRHFVNRALADSYQQLFARIDVQILLAAPGFELVQAWRTQQEHELRARSGSDVSGVLSDAQIARFIEHYERLTRHVLAEMPGRAGLVIDLDSHRQPVRATAGARLLRGQSGSGNSGERA